MFVSWYDCWILLIEWVWMNSSETLIQLSCCLNAPLSVFGMESFCNIQGVSRYPKWCKILSIKCCFHENSRHSDWHSCGLSLNGRPVPDRWRCTRQGWSPHLCDSLWLAWIHRHWTDGARSHSCVAWMIVDTTVWMSEVIYISWVFWRFNPKNMRLTCFARVNVRSDIPYSILWQMCFPFTSIQSNYWCQSAVVVQYTTYICVPDHKRGHELVGSWVHGSIKPNRKRSKSIWHIIFPALKEQDSRSVTFSSSETKSRVIPRDATVGFQGVASMQSQTYNPDEVPHPWHSLVLWPWSSRSCHG